jgi:hypothetical protein
MSHEASKHENFFVAKKYDSESVSCVLRRPRQAAMMHIVHRLSKVRMSKVLAAQVFFANSIKARAVFLPTSRVLVRARFDVDDERSSCAFAPSYQRFLKQDSVFFNVLVYSGGSAFRFPSARSD